MTAAPPSPLAEELAAALEWWRLAGVDRTYRDEAAAWLDAGVPANAKEPQPSAATDGAETRPAPRAAPAIGGDRRTWPTRLEDFAGWWVSEPSLDVGGVTPRVPPRGKAGAELMVIVAMPEEADTDRLLSGPHGAFLSAILQALGLPEEAVYLASALPRHTPVPDGEQLRDAGLGAILGHHIALVAPKRMIAFGRLVLPLLGHGTAQDPAASPIFNHECVKVPTMAAGGLDRLLRSAAARETFWRRWLGWTDGDR
jgi:DNA polymerase